MRRLNVKLLVSLVVGLLVLVVGVHVIHGIQIDRNAGVLLREAEQAEKEAEQAAKDGDSSLKDRDNRLAVKKYVAFIKHRPNQVPPKKRLALLAADLAVADGATNDDRKLALRSLESAAKYPEPEMDEVRRRLVDFLMGLGGVRFVDAIDYLDDLRKAAQERGKREPELDVKWARCQIAIGKERSCAGGAERVGRLQ